jgi:hypothetical protein
MKQLIMDVLEDMSNDQINLASETARETIANIILATIRSKDRGWYLDCNHTKEQEEEDKKILESHLSEEWKVKASWVCSICGKNTYNIDWDYIGSGTNHLGCELKLELEEPVRTEDGEYVEDGIRREKNWSQKKHEDKVFGKPGKWREDIQKQAYLEMTSDGLPEGGDTQAVLESYKLAEEIVDSQDEKWIYESPDGGKTVFRRPFGDYDMKNKEEINWETKEPTGRKFTEYPYDDGK